MQENYDRLKLMDWIAIEAKLTKSYKANLLNDWTGVLWHGNGVTVPRDSPLCGWKGELCVEDGTQSTTLIIALSTVGMVVMFIAIIVSIILIKRYMYEQSLKEIDEITLKWDDVIKDKEFLNKSVRSLGGQKYYGGLKDLSIEQGMVKNTHVIIKRFKVDRCIDLQDRQVLIDLKEMRDLHHDNINRFVGICAEHPNTCILMEYEVRGSLRDIIADDIISLVRDFKVSLVLDTACGMWYIHQSVIEAHGCLTSHKCVIDNRWTCKITGHGLGYVKQQVNGSGYKHPRNESNPSMLLWTAPEILQHQKQLQVSDLQKADIYSFAMIAHEVFQEDELYAANDTQLDAADIIKAVEKSTKPPCRPDHYPGKISEAWVKLIEECWSEKPDARPSFVQIILDIENIHKHKNLSLVDNMIKRLEKHTNTLEELVADRSMDLVNEKHKVELLLKELLPPTVAQALTTGKSVDPEVFDTVTIFFSDIVGFTRISALAEPLEITALLNNMYTLFDEVADNFDVYKVATIGDAYMVASGVPIRNGDKHAEEICNMSLSLLEAIQAFPIPHLPKEHLKMRIGIHSGSCVGAVTGLKMPRYLLFGDTVDIAAKLESGGEPMRIHISDATRNLLPFDSQLDIGKRGEFYLKGKGYIVTYWLYPSNKINSG